MSRLAIAVSGGTDSLALLHATLACIRRQAWPIQVHALHVHHGLVDEADAWLAALSQRCARWRRAGSPLSFHFERVQGQPRPAESIEAWAREVRYAALARMAHASGASLVWLAQHRRDQAETFLVQALRGSGPAGLAGMAKRFQRDGLSWERPWLDQPREAIEAYVRRHRLRPVVDPTNADPRYVRGALRSSIWPALHEARAQAEASLSQAARRQAEADACLQDLALIDAWKVSTPTDEGAEPVDRSGMPPTLGVGAWNALPAARRANLLRRWLHAMSGRRQPDSLIRRLDLEAGHARGGARWPAQGGWVVLRRAALIWQGDAEDAPAHARSHRPTNKTPNL